MNTINKTIIGLFVCLMWAACTPDDNHDLGGQLAEMPGNWNITATDVDNEVVISFAPLTFIDGSNILGVQFSCLEAGIDAVMKDDKTTEIRRKVYKGGEYTLYVAAITRAGTGIAKEVKFNVEKNLLLENLGTAVLPEAVSVNANNGNSETFYRGELYIEQNSIISLTGVMASDDVIVNLDFFSRESTNTVKFLGRSGVYGLYWNPVRKNVLIEPLTTAEIAPPNYYLMTGPGIGYPTTVESDAIIAALGGGNGRYTTWWAPGASILSRVIMRNIGTDTYQATICIKEGAAFKPFSNVNWGNDTFAAENCTFTGSDLINPSGDWSPNGRLDLGAFYRFTVNAATKVVKIEKVNSIGEVLPEEPGPEEPEPGGPIVSDNFDLATSKVEVIEGELFLSIFQTLEKDAEYTLKGLLADAEVVYNLDFFERISESKVKFLGEAGDYNLYFSPARKIFILKVETPDFPDYLIAIGKGFAYPSKLNPFYVPSYPQNATSADILRYVLYRRTGDNTYQATVMLKGGNNNLEFKGYHASGGGKLTNNWANGGEYKYEFCNFSGLSGIFASAADGNNWVAGTNLNETLIYRVTITITEEKKSADVKVENVDWNGGSTP